MHVQELISIIWKGSYHEDKVIEIKGHGIGSSQQAKDEAQHNCSTCHRLWCYTTLYFCNGKTAVCCCGCVCPMILLEVFIVKSQEVECHRAEKSNILHRSRSHMELWKMEPSNKIFSLFIFLQYNRASSYTNIEFAPLHHKICLSPRIVLE